MIMALTPKSQLGSGGTTVAALEKFLADVLLNLLHPHHTLCMLAKRNIISLYSQVIADDLIAALFCFSSEMTKWMQYFFLSWERHFCCSRFIHTSFPHEAQSTSHPFNFDQS